MTSEERLRRIGINEALYRQVNERMRDLNETFATFTSQIDIMCECGSGECSVRISMPQQAYEQMRSDPELFAVVPGHQMPEAEYVIEKHDSYDVIRKDVGIPAQIAEETDPRG